jgi:hypothetical protein
MDVIDLLLVMAGHRPVQSRGRTNVMDIAKPSRCQVRVEQVGDDLVLRRWSGSIAGGGFLLIWLTGWTLGCVLLAGLVLKEPTLEHILFAIPFWASWAFVACVLARMLFGHENLRIGQDGLAYRSRAIVTLVERHVPLSEIKGVAHLSKIVDSESGRTEHGLRIDTVGRPIRFGQGVEPAEQSWLAELLQQHLQGLMPDRPLTAAKMTAEIEVLRPDGTLSEPPSDSRIRLHREFDRIDFVRQGTFSLTELGVVTFINLFWNGGVSVFVMQLLQNFEWPLFFFLIPFEVVGFCILLAWLGVLTAPFRFEKWGISPIEITSRFSILGLGRTKRIESQDTGRIELRKSSKSNKQRTSRSGQDEESDTPYSLGLVDRDGRDLLVIGKLTEGEARWIGGELCNALKGSLPKDEKTMAPRTAGPALLYDRWLDAQ